MWMLWEMKRNKIDRIKRKDIVLKKKVRKRKIIAYVTFNNSMG